MRAELFLAATCSGLHQRWMTQRDKDYADKQLSLLGIECCDSSNKRFRTLHLGMLVQRFPVLGNSAEKEVRFFVLTFSGVCQHIRWF
jgi:hypothetical protein